MRAVISEPAAEWLRRLHPLRLQYEVVSDEIPWMAPVAALAAAVRENRQPMAADNPLLQVQEAASVSIVAGLDAWRNVSETIAEQTFLAIFGSPALQAAVGIDPADEGPLRKAGKSPLHRELVESRIAQLKARVAAGSVEEGAIRALLYVGMPLGSVDERGFEAIRRMRGIRLGAKRSTLAEFKRTVHDQYFLLLLDPEAAVAAIPVLIPDAESRRAAVATVSKVLSASGEIAGEVAERLQRIARLLEVKPMRPAAASPSVAA